MTGGERTPATRECGEDVAAYVLGALMPEEVEAFHRHLDGCVVCRDEVAALQGVVDALPMAAPQQRPPKRLRRRVRRAVRAHARSARATRDRPRILQAAARRPRIALAASALAAVVAAVAVAVIPGGSSGTRVIAANVTGSPGSAELRLAGRQAQLIVRNLAPPPAGRIYEVWLKRPRENPSPTPALFDVTRAGDASVAVPGDLRGVDAVLVTAEPTGGSLRPTRAPVIVARLT
jgi:anti-sigma-K factor RskA